MVRRVFSILGCLIREPHRRSQHTIQVHCRTGRSAPRVHECQPDLRTLNSIASAYQGTCAHAQVTNTVETCRASLMDAGDGGRGVFGTHSFDGNLRTLLVDTRNAALPEACHRGRRWPYPRGISQETSGRLIRTTTRLCFPCAQETPTPRQ